MGQFWPIEKITPKSSLLSLTILYFKEMFKQVQDCVMDLVGKINNKIVNNDAKMDQNSSKKQNGLKKKVKTK